MKNFFKKNVTEIITNEARVALKRHAPIIIAITGSVGKTSTKDAIYSAIANQVSVRKSQKSFQKF